MSVTVADILKLPCLKGARVAAGKNSLQKVLTSVSVLEYADASGLQEELFDKNEFLGGEIVITAFASIARDVEMQCLNIRRLAEAGEVGLILYYVGIFVPNVDQRLIDTADSLDFILIIMPENRMNLRYSEAIGEIMGTIFEEQKSEASIVSDVLEQVSRLPEHQRTVDTVLRIVRERLRVSLILADSQDRTLGQAVWPLSMELELDRLLESMPSGVSVVQLPEERTVYCCPLSPHFNTPMTLYLVKDGEPLSEGLVSQTVEVVRLAVNIWSSQHAEVNVSELVQAILRDEPLKMRRLAEIFHIDIASVHAMWVICPEERSERASAARPARQGMDMEAYREMLGLLKETLQLHCRTVVVEMYEGCVVAFMDWPSTAPEASALSAGIMARLEEMGAEASLIRCHQLATTADVRKAFLLIREQLAGARRIWPDRRCYTLQELEFAAQCRGLMEQGEDAVTQAIAPLRLLEKEREGGELRRTLCSYLLDAQGSVTECARLLFVHKNTIKYRLGCIRELLGYRVDKLPEQFALYRGAALWRLLNREA